MLLTVFWSIFKLTFEEVTDARIQRSHEYYLLLRVTKQFEQKTLWNSGANVTFQVPHLNVFLYVNSSLFMFRSLFHSHSLTLFCLSFSSFLSLNLFSFSLSLYLSLSLPLYLSLFQRQSWTLSRSTAAPVPVLRPPYKRSWKGKRLVGSNHQQLSMKKERSGSLRGVAFTAVVFSTVAVSACLLTFPLVFHYVQTLQATVQVFIHSFMYSCNHFLSSHYCSLASLCIVSLCIVGNSFIADV